MSAWQISLHSFILLSSAQFRSSLSASSSSLGVTTEKCSGASSPLSVSLSSSKFTSCRPSSHCTRTKRARSRSRCRTLQSPSSSRHHCCFCGCYTRRLPSSLRRVRRLALRRGVWRLRCCYRLCQRTALRYWQWVGVY